MTRCHFCGKATANRPIACYFDQTNPTDATLLTLCDACQAPREAPTGYAAPFAIEEDEE